MSDHRGMHYWLLKSEPTSYSIDDLRRDRRTSWDGVRNYQARNLMRDGMQKGDLALFYHSSTSVIGIVGLCEVVSKAAHPDPSQFDKRSHHYDPAASLNNPRWLMVDVQFKRKFKRPITLKELKWDPFFKDMPLTQKGMRLSVQPVPKKHYLKIMKIADD